MSLNLITGYSGTSHITSASDGCTNAGLYGKGKYVLNIAEKFGAEIISNNLIRIKSGYAINQGRKIELAINDYEEVEIDNGLQGVKRCDLIVIHYEKNLTTGIETGSVKVIKGTSGDIYSDPAYTSGDIINGANEDDFLLYRVKINGLSIEAVEPLFTVTESLMTLLDNMQENSKKLMGEADISKIGDGTVKGAIGALADSDEKINQSLSFKVDTTDSRLSDARDPKAHTHDDRYYTESEIDTKLKASVKNHIAVLNKTESLTVNGNSDRQYTFPFSLPRDAKIIVQLPIIYASGKGISIGRNVNKDFTVLLWNNNSGTQNVGVCYYVVYII